jgi:hypothetical protein
MACYVELRRHTDNDSDALTEEGIRAALEIGRGLVGGYELLVSTGAQRAMQTLPCFACMLREQVPGGAVIEAGLRSDVEDRWRAAYQRAGSGELGPLRDADPELVEEDSAVLGAALRRVLELVPEGAKALAVGHSPTNEARGRRGRPRTHRAPRLSGYGDRLAGQRGRDVGGVHSSARTAPSRGMPGAAGSRRGPGALPSRRSRARRRSCGAPSGCSDSAIP